MRKIALPRLRFLRTTRSIQTCIYYLGKMIFARAQVVVRGACHLDELHGNAIFAPNHANELDTIVLCLALDAAQTLHERIPIFFMSREKKFYDDMGFFKALVYGGFLFRLLGAYPVTPRDERTEETRKNTLRTHRALLRSGRSIVIFPEGTRTETGELLPAKAGVAILSEQSGIPVIPVAIEGTFGLSFSNFLRGKKRIRVIFGEPIRFHAVGDTPDTSPLGKEAYLRKAAFVLSHVRGLLERRAQEEK